MKLFDLIVFTQYPNAYAPTRLLEEARNNDLRIKIYGYDKIQNINDLPLAKSVILREPNPKSELYKLRDKILSFYTNSDSSVLNHKSYQKWPILDKITQHQEFIKAGISNIPLLNPSEAKYPFIIKNKLGSHGDSVYKIHNDNDLKSVLLKHQEKDLVIQEFQTSGFDLRVIVLGNKILGIMKRTPKSGEFLSNYSQGGQVEEYKSINDELRIKKIAIKTAKHFKLDYVGVDIMMGNDGQWKVLEVNRGCQFKGFEFSTSINVAHELISFMAKR